MKNHLSILRPTIFLAMLASLLAACSSEQENSEPVVEAAAPASELLPHQQMAKDMLRDASFDLVVLDELTYMIAYDYLPEDEIIHAISERPARQSVVVTGRGGGSVLQSVMDTVSEVREVKHAFKAGIMARQGVDY